MAIQTLIPKLLRVPASLIPRALPTTLLARTVNRLMESQHLAQRMEEIEGSKICLQVRDMDMQLYFEVKGSRLRPSEDKDWDMRITGTLYHFLVLATRSEDPDTLFFNRSLVLEGKTEVGLYVKNLIDAVDLGIDQQLEALTGKKPPEIISRTLNNLAGRVRSVLGH